MIWIYIIVCIPILAAAVALWLWRRNEAVCQFQKKLLDMASDAAQRIVFDKSLSSDVCCKEYGKLIDIMNRYSYNNMLCSLRPLKLEAWFTDEEIKILTGR